MAYFQKLKWLMFLHKFIFTLLLPLDMELQ